MWVRVWWCPCACVRMDACRGFLTPFDVTAYELYLERVLSARSPDHPLFVTLRTRRRCELVGNNSEVLCLHNCLNEVVVDRGASPVGECQGELQSCWWVSGGCAPACGLPQSWVGQRMPS